MRFSGSVPKPDLTAFLHALRQRWWVALGTALVATAVAALAMSRRDPAYTAEALLQQQSDNASVAAAVVTGRAGDGMDFAAHLELMRSRSVLGEVIDSLGLQLSVDEGGVGRSALVRSIEVEPAIEPQRYLLDRAGDGVVLRDPDSGAEVARAGAGGWLAGPGFRLLVDPAALGDEPVEISLTDWERALERLRGRIVVEPGRGIGLMRVRFTDTDPVDAAAVVNHVSRAYEQFRARSIQENAGTQREFLAGQLVQLSDSLRRAQDQLLTFQQSEGSLNPELEGSALVGALTAQENALRQLQYEENLLESLVLMLDSPAAETAGLQRLIALGADILPGGAQLYGRVQELTADRNRLTASRFGLSPDGPEVEVVDSLLAATWGQIRQLSQESLSLRRQAIATAEARVAEIRADVGEIPQRSASVSRLEQQVAAVQGVFDLLLGRYYEAQVAEAVETGDVRVVDPATVPLQPTPVPVRFNLTVAFLVGLLLGAGGVGVHYQFDQRVNRTEHAEAATALPVFGMVPHLKGGQAANATGKEAFRSLVVNLSFLPATQRRTLAITSAGPDEGKSTLAANLAITLAHQGARVLLIDADLRRPLLHQTFGLPRGPGLTEVLAGEAELASVVHRREGSAMEILTGGRVAENPPALLNRATLGPFLQRLHSRYDVVLLDTAPVLAVSDALLISSAADGVLFVVRANRSDQTALSRATQSLRKVGAALVGVVLTDVPVGGRFGRSSYGYYQYASYYGDGEPAGRRGPRQKQAPKVEETPGAARE